jgi:hypothetical protein
LNNVRSLLQACLACATSEYVLKKDRRVLKSYEGVAFKLMFVVIDDVSCQDSTVLGTCYPLIKLCSTSFLILISRQLSSGCLTVSSTMVQWHDFFSLATSLFNTK